MVNLIKNMTKKSKILCAIGILLIVILIGVIIICKCFNTTGSVDEYEEVISNDSDGQLQYKYTAFSGYKELYNFVKSEEIDKYYMISDKEYHIVLKDNFDSIVVNDKSIFESENKILSVDLYNTILIVYTTSDSSDFKSILYLIDLDGNVIKKVDNVLYGYRNFHESKLRYTVDNYDYNSVDGDVIYKSHSTEDHTVTFLDGLINTDEINEHPNYIYTPVCMNKDGCILYEKDGLKISIGKEGITEDGIKYIDEKLYVNDNKIDKAYNLLKITLLPDGYLFITSCFQDGYTSWARIIDWNGNIITDFNNIIDEGYFTSHPLVSGLGNDFSGGVFHINTVSGTAQNELGQYLNIGAPYPDDYVICKTFKFNYLGNGHVDNGYVDEIIDLGDLRNYYDSKLD